MNTNRNKRYATALGVVSCLAGLLLGGCASAPQDGVTKVQSIRHQSDGVASESELPSGRATIAGPDGKELKGATIDIDARRKAVTAVADRMTKLGRDATDDEARAYLVVYGASQVLDERGEVIGYWVGRYYTVPEYEQRLVEARQVVEKAERQG